MQVSPGAIGGIIWLIVAAVLFIIECATAQLVCIWFVVGSLAAMLVSFLGGPEWLQLLVFLITSVAVLFVGRPFVKDRLLVRKQATNSDRTIGMTGVVIEEINNLEQSGRISVDGLNWSARTVYDGMILPVHTQVIVRQIAGVKLIVEPLQ